MISQESFRCLPKTHLICLLHLSLEKFSHAHVLCSGGGLKYSGFCFCSGSVQFPVQTVTNNCRHYDPVAASQTDDSACGHIRFCWRLQTLSNFSQLIQQLCECWPSEGLHLEREERWCTSGSLFTDQYLIDHSVGAEVFRVRVKLK